MSLNHYVSDFVARINNATTANNSEVVVLKSKLIESCVNKLTKLKYFQSFTSEGNYLKITLNNKKIKLKVISKPGQRVYIGYNDFPKILGGEGYNIVSTPKGVLTNVEAKKEKVGGELLFQIY